MWKSKLKLKDGETLKHVSSHSKGSMAQEDITEWSVLNPSGEIVGKVIHKDHTSLNGFRRTQSVRQTDIQNNVLVDESWVG